jgi:hypothetical protein
MRKLRPREVINDLPMMPGLASWNLLGHSVGRSSFHREAVAGPKVVEDSLPPPGSGKLELQARRWGAPGGYNRSGVVMWGRDCRLQGCQWDCIPQGTRSHCSIFDGTDALRFTFQEDLSKELEGRVR